MAKFKLLSCIEDRVISKNLKKGSLWLLQRWHLSCDCQEEFEDLLGKGLWFGSVNEKKIS